MRQMQWVVLCFLGAAQVYGQATKTAFDAFRDSVVKQQLVLRNFSGEDQVHAVWTGTQFALDDAKWRTFGVLQVRSVKLKGEQVKLECERHVVLWNQANTLVRYAVGDSVEISVDLRDGDAAQLLPKLRDALFYSSNADALNAIPKPLQRMVPAHVNQSLGSSDGTTKPCDCSEHDPCASAKGAQGYAFPRVVYTPDPEFSDEARKRKINGNVVTAFMVDETGHVHDLWIARPVGYGLDEKAANAVLQYRFNAATCHGTPISVPLGAEVNFQIF